MARRTNTMASSINSSINTPPTSTHVPLLKRKSDEKQYGSYNSYSYDVGDAE